ncbi:MAG: retropepsin-like aspartic protease [Candidatus Omnitrophota bacterium]
MGYKFRLNLCVFISLLVLISFIPELKADTVYFKSGRSLEGIILKEEADKVSLQMQGGVVELQKKDIGHIEKSDLQEAQAIKEGWKKEVIVRQEAKRAAEEAKEKAPRNVSFEQKKGHIFVEVLLNKKVKANLLLDTGATLVVLSENIVKQMGINLAKEKRMVQMQIADGSKINSKLIIVKTMKVEGVEVQNVEAAVMPAIFSVGDAKDGVLGMSFLKRFNFKVDNKLGKLVLEKL